jgi:beta-phosphoglucomutase
MTKAVIFDMDGVLVDSYRAHYESWRLLGLKHGLTMTEAEFTATFGRTSADIIRNLWGDAVDEADIPAWDDEKEALYRDELRKSFPAMDGASELLDALAAAGIKMAVGSSGPPENVQLVLDCLPGAEAFTATVTGQDVTRGKPDPEVFLIAGEKLGVAPEDCAVIEDATAGIEAARRAGMTAVAITGTADRSALIAAGAHVVVDSLRELSPSMIGDLIADHAG